MSPDSDLITSLLNFKFEDIVEYNNKCIDDVCKL